MLIGRLPAPAARLLARFSGGSMYYLLRRRRRIALRNLTLCFPQWTDKQRKKILRQHFQALGQMLIENAWSWSTRKLTSLPAVTFSGLEQLRYWQNKGRAVLLVSGHFTGMDIGGRYVCEQAPLTVNAVYRPLRNPVLEWYQTRGRLQYAESMISKYDANAIMQALRAGKTVWYAADQDFGPRRSIFVPFFKQQTATLKATWTLARRGHAVVLPMFPRRLSDGSYHVTIESPIPCDRNTSAETLLTHLNERIEAAVRQAPEQYWWVHRRFKTQPQAGNPYQSI